MLALIAAAAIVTNSNTVISRRITEDGARVIEHVSRRIVKKQSGKKATTNDVEEVGRTFPLMFVPRRNSKR